MVLEISRKLGIEPLTTCVLNHMLESSESTSSLFLLLS